LQAVVEDDKLESDDRLKKGAMPKWARVYLQVPRAAKKLGKKRGAWHDN
jgi:hypothetical protein